jgi:hypothetical protein
MRRSTKVDREYETYRTKEKGVQDFVGKLEGKRPFGRSECLWKDNIRTDLKEIGREGVDNMHRPQDRESFR